MKLFVTGGTGVIGTRALRAGRCRTRGHGHRSIERQGGARALVRRNPVTIDLFDAAAVRSGVAGHEAVVHLGTNIPPMARAARSKAWDTNERLRREATNHLVDAAIATGATRYVQQSICFPYLDQGDA